MTIRYATYAELIDALRSIPSGGGGLATNGLPVGGSTGQQLVKSSAADYDTAWTDPPVGVPVGGTLFQSLVKASAADYDIAWGNPAAPNGLPVGGTALQILVKSGAADYAATWGNWGDYYANYGRVTKGITDTTTRTSAVITGLTTTGLTFTVSSGTMYHLKAMGAFRSAATTTGLALGFSSLVATTYAGWNVSIEQAAAGTDSTYVAHATSLASTLTSTGVVAAATDYQWEIEARFQPSAGGTVTIGFRTEVSGSTVTWQPGAMAILTAVT